MFTGRDALFTVERAISRVRADEGQLDQTLRSAMEEAARLRREESAGFRALARIKLDALMREKVLAGLDANERRALDMIEKHRQALEELACKRDEAQKRLTEAEAAKHKADQDLAKVLEALDQLRHRTADTIKANPDWRAAQAATDAARKIAANADEKASQSEADLGEKRKPYESDPLFMYLWNKQGGQAGDTSWYLVRYFDRMVVRLIGYLDARANYAMLREIPLRLREHANEKQMDLQAATDRVAVLERKALVAAGIEPLEAQLRAGNEAVKAGEDAVVKITNELQEIEAGRQRALGSGDEAVYARATDLLAQALTQEDLQRLYEEALLTPAKEDEQIVMSIGKARDALQRVDTEVSQIRAQIRELARRRAELEGSRDRARTVGYDNPMGNFGNAQDMIGQVIGGILAGALRGQDLDRVLRDNYRYPEPRADPDFGGWRGGASFPPPWGRSGSWDRSGDSGWRTGGSF
jgi:chromosome segregation ATPase